MYYPHVDVICPTLRRVAGAPETGRTQVQRIRHVSAALLVLLLKRLLRRHTISLYLTPKRHLVFYN